jgi:hypothetical protein
MVHADTNSTPPDARTDWPRNNTATPNGVSGTARDPTPAGSPAKGAHVAPASVDHSMVTPCPPGTPATVTTGGEPCATVTDDGAAGAVHDTVNAADTHGDHSPPDCATRTHAR